MLRQARLFDRPQSTASIALFVREAVTEDIESIGNILLTTWKDVYKYTVKPAGQKNASAVLENTESSELEYKQCFTESELITISGQLTDSCNSNLNKENYATFVACEGQRVIGFARLIKKEESASLDKIYILSEFRGMGLGRQLIMNCFQAAIDKFKVNCVTADVWDQNRDAIDSYNNNCFVKNESKNKHQRETPSGKIFEGFEMICVNCQESVNVLREKLEKYRTGVETKLVLK